MAVSPRRTQRSGNRSLASARKAAAKPARDVTQYADKPATGYHKAFASWIVKEVGFSLDGLSPRAAFLAGVSIATAARAAFQESDFLEAWREKNGESKPGPKPGAVKAEAATVARATKRRPAPEPEPEEDEEWEEDDETEADDEFDSEDDSEEEESDEEDWEDEAEEEPAPAPKRRAPAKKAAAAPARSTRSGAPAKAAPAKSAPGRKPKPPADDDDFIF